jgi:cystathionine gamma-synthase
MRIETLAVHAGHGVDPATGAVTPPIVLSTTYERSADGSYPHGYIYTRTNNPNREALERCLQVLEGGAACAAFSSGSAATQAIFQALRPGDHVLLPEDVYYGTVVILRDLFAAWGLEMTQVDMTRLDLVRRATRPTTRLIWVESPSNPLLKITDIAAVAGIAHDAGALCAVYNTWATPILQRPLELGADLAVHATTKYLGGHSDVLGGAVVARAEDEFTARMIKIQRSGGAVPSPFDCWLILRGIRTLPLRVRAQSASALRLAEVLCEHPRVAAVHYPALPTHPGQQIAARQMAAYGGMLSFQVHGGQAEALDVTGRVRLFTSATSLGGTESLIEHRASVEGPASRTPPNLLRCSIGLENEEDLLDDLTQALSPERVG